MILNRILAGISALGAATILLELLLLYAVR